MIGNILYVLCVVSRGLCWWVLLVLKLCHDIWCSTFVLYVLCVCVHLITKVFDDWGINVKCHFTGKSPSFMLSFIDYGWYRFIDEWHNCNELPLIQPFIRKCVQSKLIFVAVNIQQMISFSIIFGRFRLNSLICVIELSEDWNTETLINGWNLNWDENV